MFRALVIYFVYNIFFIYSHSLYTSPKLAVLPSLKIINGISANIKHFPYVVSLQYNGTFFGHDYEHFCCASILSEQWIITSGQCAQGKRINDFHVRVGSSQYYQNGIIHSIKDIIIHPNFNEITRDYDVALIKLSEKLVFSENIQPIKLAKREDVIPANANFSIVGWGATQLLGKISDDLLESHIEKISDTNCRLIYGKESLTSRMFCVFSEGFGPCVGDSGSPAVLRNKLIGLASWSYNCGYRYPMVYANTSSILNWINDIVQLNLDAVQ